MKILEIELLSDDIPQTEAFYKKVLGLQPYLKEGKSTLFFDIGFTKLIFRKSENVKPVYHFAVDIPNNLFDEAYRKIKSQTSILEVEPGIDIAEFTNWDARSFYFYDNNGNVLEFITRYGNKTFANTLFSSESYLTVSEIGLVTAKVPEFADGFAKKFGIPIFHRQPRGDKFTVSGDDDGLFIVVENGREWYPIAKKAYSFRTRVLFMNDGVLCHFIK